MTTPFFFFLHGNVDRLWAEWQRDQSLSGYSLDRLTQAQAYNGANTAAGSEMGGTMGPWDGIGAGIAPWTSAGGRNPKGNPCAFRPEQDFLLVLGVSRLHEPL